MSVLPSLAYIVLVVLDLSAAIPSLLEERSVVAALVSGEAPWMFRLRMRSHTAHSENGHTSIMVDSARIDVLDPAGIRRQTLVARPEEAALFLSTVELVDVDFDGVADLRYVRDAYHCVTYYEVWRFDAKRRRFVTDRLTRALGELQNMSVDPTARVVADHPGCHLHPGEHFQSYRIVGDRLVPAT